jgi:hypothetical protein
MTLGFSSEKIYAAIVFVMFAISLVIWISRLGKHYPRNSSEPFYRGWKFWGAGSLIMLACFFIIPDEFASGGVVKFRFEYLFYLFLIPMMATIDFPKWFNAGLVISVSLWIVIKLYFLYPMMKQLDSEAAMLMKSTEYIKPNSLLLPLSYSDNWMHDNIINYMGTRKQIFVLDNYEATTPHFPLEWKQGRNPYDLLGTFAKKQSICADFLNFENTTRRRIDYVLMWKFNQVNDSCSRLINARLKSHYKLVYSDGPGLILYEKKQ